MMIFKQFKENNPLSMIAIPIFVGLAFSPSFFKFNPLINSSDLVSDVLGIGELHWISLLINIAFISIGSIFIGSVFNRNNFYERNAYIAPIIYCILSFSSLRFQANISFHLTNLLFVLVLHNLFKIHQEEQYKEEIFKVGFILGLASLMIISTSILFIAILFAITALKGFKVKEFLLSIIGFIIPFLYFFTYQLFQEEGIQFLKLFSYQNSYPYFSEVSWIEWSMYGIFIFLFILALFATAMNRFMSIKFKEKSKSLIWILFIGIIGMALFKVFHIGNDEPLIIIPFISLLFATTMLTKKLKHISNFILYSVIALFLCSFFF